MQGYDSVELRADVELGGTDQKFNLLVGRELQNAYGQSPQIVCIMPILEGLDGKEKMSKSLGNYVGINEAPDEIFGKLMSIPDELMMRYYELLTDLTPAQLTETRAKVANDPRNAKVDLGRLIVARYHGTAAGDHAVAEFEKRFGKSGDGLPTEIETVTLTATDAAGFPLVKALVSTGMAPSGGEAKRLLQQGGVKIDQEKVVDLQLLLPVGKTVLVQCGKRQFRRITVNK